MKKVIYFISEDWVFLNHRLELAKKIQKKRLQSNISYKYNALQKSD